MVALGLKITGLITTNFLSVRTYKRRTLEAMDMIAIIKKYLQKKTPETPVVEAYDVWAGSYDCQPGNLVLDLDEQLFSILIKNINLRNRRVADIGCGTGRHWQKLYNLKPNVMMGFDVSGGMLEQLKRKFPDALIQQITDNKLNMLPEAFIDCIITTLTIAHIKNIEEAIATWSRVIKNGGDLLVTDFHPAILAKGGKRSFTHNGVAMAVVNYVHPIKKIKSLFRKYGFTIVKQEERHVDETVKHFYETQNAMAVYERFKGMPVIYGFHLKKENAAE